MLKAHDFKCVNDHVFDDLVNDADPAPTCPTCGAQSEKCISAGHVFGTIIPKYPGSDRHTAGGIHKHINRPAEKTYVTVPRGPR